MMKRTRAALVLLALCAVVSACRSTPDPVAPEDQAPEPAAPEAPVLGAKSGLEVRRWTVDDQDLAVARMLSSIPRGEPVIDVETSELLAANGLRVIALAPDQIEPLRARFRLAGAVEKEWLGQTTEWAELVRGPPLRSGQVVALDSGPYRLDRPGPMRLLVRCWETPLVGEGGGVRGGLRVEIIPQHAERDTRSAYRRALEGARTSVEEQGFIFERLALVGVFDGSEALLLVGEEPGVEWGERVAESSSVTVPERTGPSVGPFPARSASIGEAVLAAEPGKRSLIILIPHASERFELLR